MTTLATFWETTDKLLDFKAEGVNVQKREIIQLPAWMSDDDVQEKATDQIIESFGVPLLPVDTIAEEKESIGPDEEAQKRLASLRHALLPESTVSAKFSTTYGPDLHQVTGTLYAASSSGQDSRIIWVKIDSRILPTVYTLWQHPRLVPLLHTPDTVVQKLCNGSPLMTPGLARGPPFPKRAVKDSIVAVASLQSPTVPVVVGVCEIDISALDQVHGLKGHAIRTEHWAGDELWAWSSAGLSGQAIPSELSGWEQSDESSELSALLNKNSISEVPLDQEKGNIETNESAANSDEHLGLSQSQAAKHPEICETILVPEPRQEEIDEAFWQAFLYGIHDATITHPHDAHHGISFPIAQSQTISSHVLPFLPVRAAGQFAASFAIKKTSWKNAKKFIKALEKKHLVKSKDRDGGECVITEVFFNEAAFKAFVPYPLPRKEAPTTSSNIQSDKQSGISSQDASIGQIIKRLHLFRLKASVSDKIAVPGAKSDPYLTATEARSALNSYLESERLILETNRRIIKIDPFLARAVYTNPSEFESSMLARGHVPRDALQDRFLSSCCSQSYLILRGDVTRESCKTKPRSGPPPQIKMTLESRSGNRTITKISGVEEYGIAPQPLADELQKACAGSTGVSPLVGSSPKQCLMEVMVQGPQKEAVFKALERRGIKKEWIDLVDKKKSKR